MTNGRARTLATQDGLAGGEKASAAGIAAANSTDVPTRMLHRRDSPQRIEKVVSEKLHLAAPLAVQISLIATNR